MRKIIFGIAILSAGCASSPAKKRDSAEAMPKATYSERVTVTSLAGPHPSSCATPALKREDWRAALPVANACVKAKDWTQVEKIGQFLARNAPLTPWGAFYLGMVAMVRKDYPRSRWMYELALKKAPNEGLFHYELGRVHWESNDMASAMKEFKLASDLGSVLTEAHYMAGAMALRKGELAEARKYLERALKTDQDHLAARLTAAQVEIEAKDFERAEEHLNRAVAVNPRSSKSRLALAQIQEIHLKKAADALRTYRDLKQLSAERKLDENVQVNLEEKIQALERSLSQARERQEGQVTVRKPTAERQVRK